MMSVNHIEIGNESSHKKGIKIQISTAQNDLPLGSSFFLNGLKSGDYPSILKFIRKWFLDSPSKYPYNLQEDKKDQSYDSYKTMYPSWIFINSILTDFYKEKPPGFFVEAGALDGERFSNTLQLERRLNWTGLLVEGDKNSYQRLMKKNRKCWSSPLCLATKSYPHEVIFTTYPETKDKSFSNRGSSGIKVNESNYSFEGAAGYPNFQKVMCVPASYLLDSLNVTHVDFFSLDVEGVEMEVLKHFPFDKITVDVWAIEHENINDPGPGAGSDTSDNYFIAADGTYRFEDPVFINFMERKGYYLFDMFCQVLPDYIFVRVNSKLFKELNVPESKRIRKGLCLIKKQWEPKLIQSDLEHLRDKRHWPYIRLH